MNPRLFPAAPVPALTILLTRPAGIPEYGCYISAEKRLTNFDVALRDGEVVPPLSAGEGSFDLPFPTPPYSY